MMVRSVSLLLLAVVMWSGGALAGCPASGVISPCQCREEIQGRIMDCAAITSGSQLATLMQNDMGDPHFDFFQAIKSSGSVTLDSLPDNTFADKTLTHIWIGDSTMASVSDNAFVGLETKLLEILLGITPSLTSFPFSSLAGLPLLFKLQITSSGLTSVTSFADAPALSEIKLTNAAITTVASGAFAGLPNLAMVDLGGNPLTALTDGAFETTTTQPWTLYLDDCSVGTVAAGAFSGTLPLGVHLLGNAFTTVDQTIWGPLVDNIIATFEPGTNAAGLYFGNNPIVCGCDLAWFATDAAKLPFVKMVVCSNDEVAGVAVEDLPAEFFASC